MMLVTQRGAHATQKPGAQEVGIAFVELGK